MEIHYLYTRPIAVAREAGYEMKRMEMLRDALIFKQRRSLGLSAPAGKA
jgi:2-dehydropantoate 2-reductase